MRDTIQRRPIPAGGPYSGRSLSLAMIVRDGGPNLDLLLAEARPWVDEIVVGDTGSRDESRNVVLRHGGRVLDVPWQEDFAAARNAVLGACRGSWLLILDADERLDPRGWRELDAWLGRAEAPCAGSFVTRNYLRRPHERRGWRPLPVDDPYTLPPAAPAAGFVPTNKVRLVPNRPAIRFRGRLHETLEASLRDVGCPVVAMTMPVHHLGPLDPEPGKTRRYLRLAERKAAEQPHDPQAWSELADCAWADGDPGLALVAIERTLALDPGRAADRLTYGWLLKEQSRLAEAESHLEALTMNADLTEAQLADCCHLRAQIAVLEGRNEAASPLLALAVRLAPDNGHVFNTVGVWHLVAGRGDAARRALERAEFLLPGTADPAYNLGRMYAAAGRLDEAARHYRRALDHQPDHAGAGAALAALATPEPDPMPV